MRISISRRQPRLGAALLAATLLPLSISAALAEQSTTGATADPLHGTASPFSEHRQQAVPYGDLDLDTAEGLETLNQRIAVAVRYVCWQSDPRDVHGMRDARECRERAQAQATADVAMLDGAAAFGTK